LSIPPWVNASVLEVGISKKGKMAKHAKLIRPDIVAVTCIGSEHGTSLGELKDTCEEKAHMVRVLPKDGLAILNGDDPYVKKMLLYTKARSVTHGYADTNDLQASFIKSNLVDGTLFSITEGDESFEVSTQLLGKANIRSIMAALIVAKELGIDRKLAIKRLGTLSPAPERLELMHTPMGVYILVDSLKSAFETVKLSLETLEDLPADRKVVILGEVEEPSGSLGELYRKIGADVARIASHLIFVGSKRVKRPLFGEAKRAGMNNDNLFFVGSSVSEAIEQVLHLVKPGALVLIKGRSSQKLGRIALALNRDSVLCTREFCSQNHRCFLCDKLKKNYYDDHRQIDTLNHTEEFLY